MDLTEIWHQLLWVILPPNFHLGEDEINNERKKTKLPITNVRAA